MVVATVTSSIEDAVIITDGIGAAVTTSGVTIAVIIISGVFAVFAFATHCPGEKRMAAMRTGRALKARPVQPALNGDLEFGRNSAQPHLNGDPDQVRMVLGAEFLLEQGRGVGDGLVGNLQRIGDFDDLVATAQ
jgi:hypothetical protein